MNSDQQEIKQNTSLLKKSTNAPKSSLQILCLVRNGEFYCKQFIEYHKKLGIERFIFLDNGSTDNTIAILQEYPEVELYQCKLPYKKYWHSFKEFLLYEYGFDNWSLVLDIDEFFDFPLSQYVEISEFISYLDYYNYNSVITHMVDLYPNKVLNDIKLNDNFLSEHKYFQEPAKKTIPIDKLTAYTNTVSNYSIEFRLGGWRHKMFDVGDVLLTKMSLIKYNKKLDFKHDHFLHNSNTADICCSLKHYKFSSNFIDYTKESVKRKNHFNESAEYLKYSNFINNNKEKLNFYSGGNNKVYDFETLIQLDIFVLSPNFMAYFSHIIEKMHKPQIGVIVTNIYKNHSKHLEELLHQQRSLLKESNSKLKAIESSITWRVSTFIFINPINKLINIIK